ncbi:MAG: HlyC/CorC family transporter [Bacteroidetes bacterium]|nr:HlyC/CorC family transporter [Bacteroidota bacterium]
MPQQTEHSQTLLQRILDKLGLVQKRKISEEAVKQILEEGERSGAIEKTEHELIKSIFEFTDTTVKEVMIPRTDVFAVDISTPREKLINTLIEQGYTRVPVYKDSIDNILGIVYTKDLIGMIQHKEIIAFQDIIRPAHMVPESKKISVLLRELQKRRQHMAVVIDEFGGTEGIVTMEDIIEEIVGEIRDEYDEEQAEIETAGDGSVLVNGNISIDDFNNRFGTAVPEHHDYDTLSGFLHTLSENLPAVHQEIRYQNISFVIAKKNDRRIKQVKVKILEEQKKEEKQDE